MLPAQCSLDMASVETLTDAQVGFFLEQGYLKLGKVIPDSVLQRLGERITALMMGDVADAPYEKMMFSVCPSQTGSWDDPASRQTYPLCPAIVASPLCLSRLCTLRSVCVCLCVCLSLLSVGLALSLCDGLLPGAGTDTKERR